MIFMVFVVALVKAKIMSIYSFYKAQITLLINIAIFIKYTNFLDNFSLDSIRKLPKYTRMNNYFINPLDDK